MTDDPRGRTLDDETLRYLEALLSSIVYGAGSLAITLFDFLFRTRRFDVMLLAEPSDRPAMPGARRSAPAQLPAAEPDLLLLRDPRQERGPTRAVIEVMPGPIRHGLDRIETSISDPNLLAILLVVGILITHPGSGARPSRSAV